MMRHIRMTPSVQGTQEVAKTSSSGLPEKSEPVKSQEEFFSWITLLYTVIPMLVVFALARSRKQKTPEPPHVSDDDFEDEVLRSAVPVLVHFYRDWNIGDRVMIKQGERLAARNGSNMKVRWLEVGGSPKTMARYPHVETPAFLFFVEGKLIYHAEGVVDEADVNREMWDNYDAHQRKKASPRP